MLTTLILGLSEFACFTELFISHKFLIFFYCGFNRFKHQIKYIKCKEKNQFKRERNICHKLQNFRNLPKDIVPKCKSLFVVLGKERRESEKLTIASLDIFCHRLFDVVCVKN